MDRHVQLGAPVSNPVPATEIVIDYYKDMKCHTVEWDDTNANAGANLRNGHVFLFAVYAETTVSAGVPTLATGNPPHIRYTSRIRFIDN